MEKHSSCTTILPIRAIMILLLERSLYASWTQNLLYHPPHTCPTPDTARVAARNDDTCWPCQTCPNYLTAGGRNDDYLHSGHGGDEPTAYLHVGAAICATRIGRS